MKHPDIRPVEDAYADLNLAESGFAASVKKLREGQGWSQGELAEKCRELAPVALEYLSQSTISRIEKGTRPVRLLEAQTLSIVFGETVWSMMHPGIETTSRLRYTLIQWREAEANATVALREFAKWLRHATRQRDILQAKIDAHEIPDPDTFERAVEFVDAANQVLNYTFEQYVSFFITAMKREAATEEDWEERDE